MPAAPVTATLMTFFHVFVSEGFLCKRGNSGFTSVGTNVMTYSQTCNQPPRISSKHQTLCAPHACSKLLPKQATAQFHAELILTASRSYSSLNTP